MLFPRGACGVQSGHTALDLASSLGRVEFEYSAQGKVAVAGNVIRRCKDHVSRAFLGDVKWWTFTDPQFWSERMLLVVLLLKPKLLCVCRVRSKRHDVCLSLLLMLVPVHCRRSVLSGETQLIDQLMAVIPPNINMLKRTELLARKCLGKHYRHVIAQFDITAAKSCRCRCPTCCAQLRGGCCS